MSRQVKLYIRTTAQDHLGWQAVYEDYKALYYGNPAYREMILHANPGWLRSWDLTPEREAVLKFDYERHTKAIDKAVAEILRTRPATAAEQRWAGAEAKPKTLSRDERRMYRDIMWARMEAHNSIRQSYWDSWIARHF